jgi:hypothetical protein
VWLLDEGEVALRLGVVADGQETVELRPQVQATTVLEGNRGGVRGEGS